VPLPAALPQGAALADDVLQLPPAVSKLALNAMRATIKDSKIRKRTEVTPDDIVREISRWFGNGSLIIGGIRTRGYNVDRRCARTPFTICKAGTKKRHIRPNKELERLNYKFLQIHNISMTSKLDPTPRGMASLCGAHQGIRPASDS
jgi:hypothetical protein